MKSYARILYTYLFDYVSRSKAVWALKIELQVAVSEKRGRHFLITQLEQSTL